MKVFEILDTRNDTLNYYCNLSCHVEVIVVHFRDTKARSEAGAVRSYAARLRFTSSRFTQNSIFGKGIGCAMQASSRHCPRSVRRLLGCHSRTAPDDSLSQVKPQMPDSVCYCSSLCSFVQLLHEHVISIRRLVATPSRRPILGI